MRASVLLIAASFPLLVAAQLGLEHRFLYPAFCSALAVHDMDGDGDGDVLRVVNGEALLLEQIAPTIFRTTHDLGAVGGAAAIHFGDVDGDGIADAVFGTNKWVRLLGGGNYAAPQTLVPGLTTSTDIRLADVDGDGDEDVICSYDPSSVKIGWAENLGGGIFGAVQLLYYSGVTFVSFDVADIDHDGDPDFAVSRSVLRWFRNDGGGTFTAQSITYNGQADWLAVADLNGDTLPDLVLSSSISNPPFRIQTVLNNGGGTFGPVTNVFTFNDQGIMSLLTADNDGDGDEDLYFTLSSNLGVPSSINSAVNDGIGHFTWSGSYFQSDFAYPYAAGDLDGDAIPDLVGMDNSGLSAIASGFGRLTSVPTPTGIIAADLDLDGDMDAAICDPGDYGPNSTGVYPLQSAWHANDSSGNVAERPNVVLQSPSGIIRSVPCDLDNDGDTDFVALFSIWGYPDGALVMRNTGGGSFTVIDTLGFGGEMNFFYPIDMPFTLRDVDQDGDADAVLFTYMGAHVCKNDGSGHFDAGQYFAGMSGANAMALIDADIDGDADIVWSHTNSAGADSVFWKVNDGTGAFGASQFLGLSPNTVDPMGGPAVLRSADLDHDGKEDLVLFNGAQIGMMRNNGGSFTVGQSFPTANIVGFAIGDMSGDSLPEILALYPDHDIVMWPNLGGATFGSAIALASAPQSTGSSDIALADMDGDGHLDVLTCSHDGSAAWLGNETDCATYAVNVDWIGTDLLQATPGVQYQWFLNGDSIPNSDQQTQATTSTGDYTVTVTSVFGCTAASDPYAVIALGMQESAALRFAAFPNPASGDVHFVSSEAITTDDALELMDMNGRVLLNMRGNGTREVIIPRGDLRVGIYVVRVLRGGAQRGLARVVFA